MDLTARPLLAYGCAQGVIHINPNLHNRFADERVRDLQGPARTTPRDTAAGTPRAAPTRTPHAALVSGPLTTAAIATLAAIQLGTAVWMLVAPHSFFRTVGPFGDYNGHYLRDAAAFTGGLGLGLACSLVWPALRAGALATAAAMIGLHAANHWADVSSANAGSAAGPLDAVSLTVAFLLTGALAVAAARRGLA